jgi:predicted dehydrogenase
MTSNRRLKVGILGASLAKSADGRENFSIRAQIPALKALPDLFEIQAVCTTKMESAKRTAEAFAVPQAFDSLERMLAEAPKIDVVCVSVRPSAHLDSVMAALEAGKHVFCEHPMGLDTADAREMHSYAQKRGLIIAAGMQYHFEPAAQHMGKLIAEGFIGTPLSFSHNLFVSNMIVPRPSHRQWLFQRSASGHLAFRSIRPLQRVTGVLGRRIRTISANIAVKATERRAIDAAGVLKSDQPDTMTYLLELDDGVSGTVNMGAASWFGTGERFEIYGTEGMLMLAAGGLTAWQKDEKVGDPLSAGLRLLGNRVNIEEFVANPIPPERLEGQHYEITPQYAPASDLDSSRTGFLVAEVWAALHRSICTGIPMNPSSKEALDIHSVMDAAESSFEGARRATVKYD